MWRRQNAELSPCLRMKAFIMYGGMATRNFLILNLMITMK